VKKKKMREVFAKKIFEKSGAKKDHALKRKKGRDWDACLAEEKKGYTH